MKNDKTKNETNLENMTKLYLYSWEYKGNYGRFSGDNTLTFSRIITAKNRSEANSIVSKTCEEDEWAERQKLKVEEYAIKDGLVFRIETFQPWRLKKYKY